MSVAAEFNELIDDTKICKILILVIHITYVSKLQSRLKFWHTYLDILHTRRLLITLLYYALH